MKHTRVGSLMTDDVISVDRATSFKDVAKLLAEHGISAVPVLDEDEQVIGIVSESDLLARKALTAGDLMSSPAVTVYAEQTVPEAARLMTQGSVERLPVIDEEDRLVGIVTRGDLLRVFLRPDSEIRGRVIQDILTDTMGISAGTVDVHVLGGVVTLAGQLEKASQIPILLRLTEQLDGVVGAVGQLTAHTDDSRLIPRESRPNRIPW
ncbi:CBS domain-containing protein [Streptomyces sp. G-G2]|uniref:CBS domain-containing protein n=1 Tax=Streptomyces sp. G-G2 TaxID=3046201 RepID=UPI0024BB0640|nr:CBS domain-containing protein [Streptomyces sp. G-G2]MDJ0383544.1 CBS domain-containing protein [Streptomyces sp. G-G2]